MKNEDFSKRIYEGKIKNNSYKRCAKDAGEPSEL